MSKIVVVYGGKSSEREVSIDSKNSICAELKKVGMDYVEFELGKNLDAELRKYTNPIIFNATHGDFGEDGRLQGMLDILEIPYTHSGLEASQIAMNKLISKNIAEGLGINVPQYAILSDINNISQNAQKLMKKPFVIKPIIGGSSIGVEVILEPEKFKLEEKHFQYGDLLVEEYIKSREIQVAILNDKAIGEVEIKPKNLFYDYESKYCGFGTEYIVAPEIDKHLQKKLENDAEKLHKFIGCNYLSRVDFMVTENNVYFLEINTQPGFTANSLVPKIAKSAGIEFGDIIQGLLKNTICK